MDEILLVVPGPPIPWAGKQTNPKTGRRFVAARQSKHAGSIIDAWERQLPRLQGFLRGDEPVAISCEFFVKRPKGHFGTGRNADTVKPQFIDARPTGRPDFSNLVKLIEDALTTHAWADDDQVVECYEPHRKVYTQTREEQPRSVIRIRRA